MAVDDMPMDELPPEIGDLDFKTYSGLEKAPPKPELPVYDFYSVEEQPFPVGGWAELGKNIVYPEIAQEAGITGKVLVYAVIDEQGRVIETSILSGIPNTGLDEAAMEAVRKTVFVPAYQRDKAVKVSIKIPITFKLN
jgi:protein TonB